MATAVAVRPEPVYTGYFADPFVWKHQGVYYAVGTGQREASGHTAAMVFPVLRSADFVRWESVTDALIRPDARLGDTFWAPAVVWNEDTFYLYYSVGHGDKLHQLRVAASRTPAGPYEDLGQPLLELDLVSFAIDPHPFQDIDGRWYLFYARDFLDMSAQVRAGTALMVQPMASMTRLEQHGTVVLRARSDWQRFQTARKMYGAVWDWHTLEGPCVVRHDHRYYCFFSGGCWENESYGVDYGVADSVLGPYSDAGNEAGPRVLRTTPGALLGPGHNSWIIGPDNQEYLVFHAWDEARTARRMFIDRLIWTSSGPRCQAQMSGSGHSLH
jgi:beta-xylosidase